VLVDELLREIHVGVVMPRCGGECTQSLD